MFSWTTARIMDKRQILQQIRSLIGCGFSFRGENFVLIDVMTDEASVVLDQRGRRATIQTDQFGQPLRRTGDIRVMPIFAVQGGRISSELSELLESNRRG